MPLVRGVARTAVAAGTATAVSNRVARRQQARWAEQNVPAAPQQQAAAQAAPPAPPPAPAPAAAGPDNRIAELEKLARLRDSGVLNDDEFAAEKARILQS
jgi:hypothetical protein